MEWTSLVAGAGAVCLGYGMAIATFGFARWQDRLDREHEQKLAKLRERGKNLT